MNKTTKIALSVLAIAVIFAAGRFSKPTKIETKVVTKTETVKVEGKTRVVYRDRVISPDGTITEKEVEREDTNTREESSSVASSEKTVTNDVGLTISALTYFPVSKPNSEPEYAVVASKRLLGALNGTVMATSDKKLGIGIGWSF